jgi:nitroreductase
MTLTTTDPLAPVAAAAIAHMNSDHADAVLAYARGLAGLGWAQAATVVQIDGAGLDLHVQGDGQTAIARVPFDPPLTDPAQLRPTLVALAEQARIGITEPEIIYAPAPDRDPLSAHRLFNTIATRRSFGLKDVSPEPINLELVALMLDAANWAPSHGKTEPWRFAVYSGDARQIIGDAFATAFHLLNPDQPADSLGAQAQRDRVWQAPVWIALGMLPDPKMPEWEELIAFGSAVQNMHLMAGVLELAGKWTSGACALHPHVADVVGFAPPTRLYGFFYLGRPATAWPAGRRRSLAAKVRWISELPHGDPH